VIYYVDFIGSLFAVFRTYRRVNPPFYVGADARYVGGSAARNGKTVEGTRMTDDGSPGSHPPSDRPNWRVVFLAFLVLAVAEAERRHDRHALP
jgi:hypothetical protein